METGWMGIDNKKSSLFTDVASGTAPTSEIITGELKCYNLLVPLIFKSHYIQLHVIVLNNI